MNKYITVITRDGEVYESEMLKRLVRQRTEYEFINIESEEWTKLTEEQLEKIGKLKTYNHKYMYE